MHTYMHIHTHVNIRVCIHIYEIIFAYFSLFPFSGQPCISDDEDVKEVDLPEVESDSGCSQPVPPENGFIRVSILTFALGLEFKNIELKTYAFFFPFRVIVFLI